MNLGFLRTRQMRKITNWKLGDCQNVSPRQPTEAINMEQLAQSACPCIKQEICNGVYWVTNDCTQGVKEGFRPRVAFMQTCAHCAKQGHSIRQQ